MCHSPHTPVFASLFNWDFRGTDSDLLFGSQKHNSDLVQAKNNRLVLCTPNPYFPESCYTCTFEKPDS